MISDLIHNVSGITVNGITIKGQSHVNGNKSLLAATRSHKGALDSQECWSVKFVIKQTTAGMIDDRNLEYHREDASTPSSSESQINNCGWIRLSLYLK